MKKQVDAFHSFAHWVADRVGTAHAFLFALLVVAAWAIAGPFLGFSQSWQLVINSATTIVTFLMVFLIQATQNREARAIHLKLDELIRTQRHARSSFEDLEDASEEELETLEREFRRIRARAKRQQERPAENGGGPARHGE